MALKSLRATRSPNGLLYLSPALSFERGHITLTASEGGFYDPPTDRKEVPFDEAIPPEYRNS